MSDTADVPTTSSSPEENESCCPGLSKPVRIIGMIICIVIGLFVGIASFTNIFSTNTASSGYWLTGGNLLCVLSTLFIQSFPKQVKQMMNPIRATCTIVLLASMVATIILAALLGGGSAEWIIWPVVAVQYVAMIWYMLSYIPGGQVFCQTCVKTCCEGCKAACCKKQTSEKEAPIV